MCRPYFFCKYDLDWIGNSAFQFNLISRASSSLANPRNLKTPNIYSEISSIAEDRSVKSQYVLNSVLSFEGAGSKPPSRMETYMADWSELPKVWQFWFWNFKLGG